jgi:hypothetical protein
MSDDTPYQSSGGDGGTEEPSGGGNGGMEPDPPGYPRDPKGRACYVTADLIKEKAAALPLGDCDALCEFADFVLRAVYWSGLCEMPPDAKGDCKTCAQCLMDFQSCNLGYTTCKRNYDACVACPCTP